MSDYLAIKKIHPAHFQSMLFNKLSVIRPSSGQNWSTQYWQLFTSAWLSASNLSPYLSQKTTHWENTLSEGALVTKRKMLAFKRLDEATTSHHLPLPHKLILAFGLPDQQPVSAPPPVLRARFLPRPGPPGQLMLMAGQ